MKGIIVDGVASAGKTTVLQLLQARLVAEKPGVSKLFLSEHYTQRMLEHKLHTGDLNAQEIQQHTERIVQTLLPYQDMLNNSKFSKLPSGAQSYVTIERFLLTYYATLPAVFGRKDIEVARSQFQSLSNCNLTQYLLKLGPKRLRANVESTLTHRNEKWAEHIESRGGVDKAIEDYEKWQIDMEHASTFFADVINSETILVDGKSYEQIADYIYEKEFK